MDALLVQILAFSDNASFKNKIIFEKSKISQGEKDFIATLTKYRDFEFFDLDASRIDPSRYGHLPPDLQAKILSFQSKISSNGIFVINNLNDSKYFKTLCSATTTRTTSVDHNSVREFLTFLNPPTILRDDLKSRAVLWAKIQNLPSDSNLILTYIPTKTDYSEKFGTYNSMDYHSAVQAKPLTLLKKNFLSLKNSYPEPKSEWFIIKSPDLAESMGFGHHQVGQIKLLNKGNPWRDQYPNERKADTKVCYNTIENLNLATPEDTFATTAKPLLYAEVSKGATLIERPSDFETVYGHMRNTGIRNLLVFSGADGREETRRKIWQVQQKMEGKFLVVVSENEKVLRDEFGILGESGELTCRLIAFQYIF